MCALLIPLYCDRMSSFFSSKTWPDYKCIESRVVHYTRKCMFSQKFPKTPSKVKKVPGRGVGRPRLALFEFLVKKPRVFDNNRHIFIDFNHCLTELDAKAWTECEMSTLYRSKQIELSARCLASYEFASLNDCRML